MRYCTVLLLVFCTTLVAHAQKTSATPVLGWMSWNVHGGDINEKIIKDVADALVEKGLDKAGYQYIVIDDGWVGGRDKKNRLIADPEKFPSGIRALAEYVHSKGLKLGIYSSASQFTCLGYTASYGFEKLDAETFAEWKVDYLKYDWCSDAPNDPESLRIRNEAISKAIADVKSIHPITLAFWGGFTYQDWFKEVGNHWRTGWDIRDKWHTKHAQRTGIFEAYEATVRWENTAGRFGHNDPDMLVIGLYGKGKAASREGHTGGCTDAEYRSQMSLWSLLASPLLISVDVRSLNNFSIETLTDREILAINQDSLSVQAKRVKETNVYDLLVKPLANGDYAVGILNKSNAPVKLDVSFREAGLMGTFRVRDVWKKKNSDKATGWSGNIAAHETIVLRLSASGQ